jgi:hypothetical protein
LATSRLHELLPAFNERNNVLALLLGCMSLASRWMGLLESQAASARREEPVPPVSEAAEPELGLMYFLLGTISFSNNFQALIQGAPPPPAASEDDPAEPAGWDNLRDLLR